MTGCYNYIDLNDIAVSSLLSIDYKDEFIITTEIRENEKDNPNASIFYEGKGKTIDETLHNINLKLNKVLYLGDLNTIVITENLINTKLNETLDYLARSSNIGYNFRILVSNDNIKDIINIIKDKNKIVGSYLKETITNTYNNTINITFNKILNNYLNEYHDIILPYLQIEKDNIIIDKAIIFNSNNEVIYLNNNDVIIYNLLNNKLNYGLIPIKYNNKEIVYQIKSTNNKLEYKDKLIINIDLTGSFNEIENINLEEKETVDKLKKEIKNNLKEKIKHTMDILKDNNIDVIGIKKVFYNKERNKIDSIKYIDYKTNINIKIEREELIFNALGEYNEI